MVFPTVQKRILIMTLLQLQSRFVTFILLICLVNGSTVPSYNSPRFYICDPECPKKCEDEKKQLCVYIFEIVPIQVEFPNKCVFQCANSCYERQLTIRNEGPCQSPEEDFVLDSDLEANKRVM
jgi:hypothetical protein